MLRTIVTMIPGCSWHARVAVLAAALVACGRDGGRASSELERAIDTELRQRYRIEVKSRCHELVRACVVTLDGGTTLPIRVTPLEGGGWDWQIDGLVLDSEPVEAYLREEVAAMGAPQGVRCTPRIRRVVAGERIACELARGGKAFITIRADGSTSIEVELDPAAAAARSEPLTPAREEELSRTSRALEDADPGVEDDEEAPRNPAAEASPPDPR